ncbi:MAG: leucine-rich repeat protein, partial [Parasporobacterium sp.]|nr:leucine-rich repeat protein [Parasporobacterium sp.]
MTNIKIPDSVTSIGESAFDGCSSLGNITIPDGVTEIGIYAFRNCSNLTYITLPLSVTRIGNHAFEECSNLSDVDYAGTELQRAGISIGTSNDCLKDATWNYSGYSGSCGHLNWELKGDGVLTIRGSGEMNSYSGSISAPWYPYKEIITKIVVEDGAENIGNYAFENCYYVTEVVLPENLNRIGDYAFESCYGLTGITIPDSVTYVGERAFEYTGLTSITIPDHITNLSDGLFSNCYDLSAVTLSDGLTSIGSFVFGNCVNLTDITLPDGLTSIGNMAFDTCGFTDITLPGSVESIGTMAFAGCENMMQITIPSGVTTIGEKAIGYTGAEEKMEGFEIWGLPGTAAETYAEANEFKFNCLTTEVGQVESIFAGTNAGGISISWSSAANADKYLVQRKLGSSAWETIATVDGTNYLDETVVSGNIYTYKVTGKNTTADITGPDSPTVNKDFLAPTTVTVRNSMGGIYVSWTPVAGATGYEIWYRGAATGDWKFWKNVTTTSLTDNVGAGKYYEYKVIPFMTVGSTKYYAYSNLSYDGIRRLAAPAITVKNAADAPLISWNAVEGAAQYYVYRKPAGGSWGKIGTTTDTSFSDATAQAGVLYIYEVNSVDAKGGLSPDAVNVYNAFAKATTVKVKNAAGGISVSWTKVAGASG